MTLPASDPDYVWWRDGVVYQVYPRSFMDSNGDGVGDLPGLIARLDYIASLGVDALWLSPINRSPMHDFGYDISDYEDIEPVFGTLSDYETLLQEAHKRGLRVILDLVLNHTSHEHPWFKESRSSRDNPKAGWYLWRDRPAEGKFPNNWVSVFGGPGWEWDEARQQYYFHIFLKEQPDLNWREPEVRAAVTAMIRRWLERGVDGFRLDVVNAYFKDAGLRDNPPRFSLDPRVVLPWFRQQHLFDIDQPELHEVYRELRQLLEAYPERASVGEIFENFDLKRIAGYVGAEQLHLAFNFSFTDQAWLPRAFQQSITAWDAALASVPGGWPCYVLSNHDKVRHVTRHGGGPFAEARAKVAAAMLLSLRGTPFLYYGEELAMPSPFVPRYLTVDPLSKRFWPFYNRDSARTPMQWDASPNAGFTAGRPWLPVGGGFPACNVAAQNEDPESVLNFYRALLRLRRGSPALRRGSYKPLLDRPVAAMTYLREHGDQTMLVALNFFGHAVDVPLPAGRWTPRLSTHGPGQTPDGTLTLAPFEAGIFEKKTN